MVGDVAIVRTWTFDIFAIQTVNPGVQWWIQGTGPATPLFLDQTEARKVEKKILLETCSPLSQGLDDRPQPPPPPLSEGLDPPLVFFNFRRLDFSCSLGSVLREEGGVWALFLNGGW